MMEQCQWGVLGVNSSILFQCRLVKHLKNAVLLCDFLCATLW